MKRKTALIKKFISTLRTFTMEEKINYNYKRK